MKGKIYFQSQAFTKTKQFARYKLLSKGVYRGVLGGRRQSDEKEMIEDYIEDGLKISDSLGGIRAYLKNSLDQESIDVDLFFELDEQTRKLRGEVGQNSAAVWRSEAGHVHIYTGTKGERAFIEDSLETVILMAGEHASEMAEVYSNVLKVTESHIDAALMFNDKWHRYAAQKKAQEGVILWVGRKFLGETFELVLKGIGGYKESIGLLEEFIGGGDPLCVRLVLTELITNAYRHGNASREDLPIVIRIIKEGNWAYIEVKDQNLKQKNNIICVAPEDTLLLEENGRGVFMITQCTEAMYLTNDSVIVKLSMRR